MVSRTEIAMHTLAKEMMLAADKVFQDEESTFNQGGAAAYSDEQMKAILQVRKQVSAAMMRARNELLGEK